MDRPSCGIVGCTHHARWVLTSPVDEPAATYLCSAHWSVFKHQRPEFAYLYSPIDALPIGFVMREVAARLGIEETDSPHRLKLVQARDEAASVLRAEGDRLAEVLANSEVKHGESPGTQGKGTLALDFSRHVAERRAGPAAVQFDVAWLAIVPEETLSHELIRWLRYAVVSGERRPESDP